MLILVNITMIYSKIDIFDTIIEDPIYNKKNNSFCSNLNLAINKCSNDDNGNKETILQDFVFTSDRMKVVKISSDHISLEFQDNFPEFYKFIYDLDTFVLEFIFDNGKRWFGKAPKHDTLNTLFQRTIVPQDELKNNPTLELDIDSSCIIEDINSDEIDTDNLDINNEVTCIFNVNKIVFLENKFYLDMRVDKISLNNYVCQQTEYMFADSDSDSD
jgi:hypothetical protein